MKMESIRPCICVDHIPDSGDTVTYGMPQLKVSNAFHGTVWFTPYCPNCKRGGMQQFQTPYQALKYWNQLQDRLWHLNGGKPDPYKK